MPRARAGGRKLEEARKTFALAGYGKWPACKELLPVALERLWDRKLPEIKLPPRPAAGRPDAKGKGTAKKGKKG